jgi:hypothetical protein
VGREAGEKEIVVLKRGTGEKFQTEQDATLKGVVFSISCRAEEGM